jgi:hypothetical protein
MNRSRMPRLAALLGGAVLLLGALGGYALLGRGSDTLRALSEARARWAARPFARYSMRVQDICEQEVTVEGLRVVESTRTFCAMRGRSIDDLFRLIERDQTVTYTCVMRGCTCNDVMSVSASYDPTLGYPTAIEVRINARPNPAHLDYWRYMWATWSIPRCGLMEGGKTIRVMTLKPL